MELIVLQLLLRQSERRFAHQRRYGNLNPFPARPLSMRATTTAVSTSLPQGPRDLLTHRALRLAKAGFALISRIAQHGPHRRPFPPRRSPAGGDPAIVQQAGDRIDADSLLGVGVEYQSHHICFRFDHFIISGHTLRFFHITIAVRRAREHIDGPLLRPMPFAAARTLDDLRPLVFRNHALKLHHQLIFRRGTGRSLEKNQFDTLTVELLRQQNLIRVLPAETIRRVRQHRLDVSLRRQIPQRLQPRPHQTRSAISLILKHPLGGNCVALNLGMLNQRRRLAGNGVILFLAIRRNARIDRRWLAHSEPP